MIPVTLFGIQARGRGGFMERIDLSGLREFADTLQSDIDAALRPGLDRAGREVQTGVRFGARTVSGEVAAGSDQMSIALTRAHHNAVHLVAAAEILVQAATKALENYIEADLTSAQQLATIEASLKTAATSVTREFGLDGAQL